jgi:hypothetical protein
MTDRSIGPDACAVKRKRASIHLSYEPIDRVRVPMQACADRYFDDG